MNWIQRKIYLYNVTFGLYMLDWWERYLFNTLVIVLMWFVLYNTSRYVTTFCKSPAITYHRVWRASSPFSGSCLIIYGEAHQFEGTNWAWQFERTDRHHRT